MTASLPSLITLCALLIPAAPSGPQIQSPGDPISKTWTGRRPGDLKNRVICVDPGHPSEISDGLQSHHGTTETRCDWVVGLKVKRLLLRDGYRVVFTKRSEMQKVRNVQRAEIANRIRAAVMLRLHCDTGGGTGFRVFYPKEPGRDGRVTGPSAEVRRESERAARAVHAGLLAEMKGSLKDNGVGTDRQTAVGRRFGALIGSIHSKVPTVLVEMVFLNNPKDAAFIKSAEGQARLARGLVDGVERYVAGERHE